MPDRKPRRMIGRPRDPRPAKGPWQWGAPELAAGCVGWLALVAIEVLAVFALVYLAVEYALPWVIDAVMDTVEQRE